MLKFPSAVFMFLLILMSCSSKDESMANENQETVKSEQSIVDQSDFESTVEHVIKAIRNKNLEGLSGLMLYLGGEESRNYNDTYRLDNSSDHKILSATADVLYEWVVNSDNFSTGITAEMNDQWGEWKVQEIILINDRKISRKYFSYLKKDGKWYLVKMENSNPLEYQPS